MITAIGAPVLFDHAHIQIPALDFVSARPDALDGAIGKSNGRKPRRAREALLSSRVADIDAVSVDAHGMSAEGSDRIHDQQGSVTVGKLGQSFKVLKHAGGCFRMYNRKHTRPRLFQSVFDLIHVYGAAPFRSNGCWLSAGTSDDIEHAFAEDSVNADDGFVARFQHVDERGFHSGAAGS